MIFRQQKRVLICGGGGFIGHHLIRRLKQEGAFIRACDLHRPEFDVTSADEFVIGDLRDQYFTRKLIDEPYDQVYQLAADMGGAGYLFTGENDADVVRNSASVNLNVLEQSASAGVSKIFFSSSACVYPLYNQTSSTDPVCEESSVYPALPDSEYGWEKLFAERLYLSYARSRRINVRIARYHNIFGPLGTWTGGREKAPAALCRKVAEANDGATIEVWGDGDQTRSFLYIDECIEATLRLMQSEWDQPLNIGSEELITINDLARLIIAVSGKQLNIVHRPGPQGVRGRRSDNRLIRKALHWEPSQPLREGLIPTYKWIMEQVAYSKKTVMHSMQRPMYCSDSP
jgi:GDP-D-mannose 3',5'-epimerase